MSIWTEKYEPEIEEIVGQTSSVEAVLDYVKEWKKGKKPLLLHGDAGVGKTCTVFAVARKLEYEVVELNASDSRTAKAVQEKALAAATQSSLLGGGKVILIDEIDGIYGTADRGGVPMLKEVVEKSRFPVIFTANDAYRQNIRPIRDKCELIKFRHPDYRAIANRLEDIAKAEKIKADKETLQAIGRRAGGDVRSAIMDLQSLAYREVGIKDVETLWARDQEREIFEVLKLIFKSSSIEPALQGMNESDKDPDELFLWIVHNLPLEYKGEDLKRAYEVVSRADLFRARIRSRQHWGFLRYVLELMSAGVSASKKEKSHHFVKYQPPDILMKMGRTRFLRARRDGAGKKVGDVLHVSKKGALRQLGYLRIICRKDAEAGKWLAHRAGLNEDEASYLLDMKKDSKTVREMIAA